MRLRYIIALIAAATMTAGAQQRKGIHQLESERAARSAGERRVDVADASATPAPIASRADGLMRRVFGWVPYWIADSAWPRFDWSALTTVGHFELMVDTASGELANHLSTMFTPLRDIAHANGARFVLTVTNFGEDANRVVLSNPQRRATLVSAILNEIARVGADGVNIDFESVPQVVRTDLVSFMSALASGARAADPDAEISMAIPAVDWSQTFDVAALAGVCDYLIMMGYDYHWQAAPTTGPVAPLAGESYNVTRSVDDYLARGIPPAKLLLGVPWYGYEWEARDSTYGAGTVGLAVSRYYGDAAANAQTYGRMFHTPTSSPWYRYQLEGKWHQGWYEDSLSLSMKYRLVNERGLGGIGIWALGYAGDATDVWMAIHAAFDAPTAIASERADAARMTVEGDRIRLTLPASRRLRIELVDMLGRRAALLADTHFDAGDHRVAIARDLPAGTYILRAAGMPGVIVRRR